MATDTPPLSTRGDASQHHPDHQDPVSVFLSSLITSDVAWGEADRPIVDALTENRSLVSDHFLALNKWLDHAYSGAQRSVTRPRTNTATPSNTNDQARRRNYKRNKTRATLYQKTQELFKKNPKELAECILGDKPIGSAIEPPPFDTVVQKYAAIFSGPSPEDNEEIGELRPATDGLYKAITVDEVELALRTTTSKSAGPDGLRISHVRRIPVHSLVLAFNAMLLWGLIPARMKQWRTVLIPKSGDTRCPDNWRPITVSSILLRVINEIIGQRLGTRTYTTCSVALEKLTE